DAPVAQGGLGGRADGGDPCLAGPDQVGPVGEGLGPGADGGPSRGAGEQGPVEPPGGQVADRPVELGGGGERADLDGRDLERLGAPLAEEGREGARPAGGPGGAPGEP